MLLELQVDIQNVYLSVKLAAVTWYLPEIVRIPIVFGRMCRIQSRSALQHMPSKVEIECQCLTLCASITVMEGHSKESSRPLTT